MSEPMSEDALNRIQVMLDKAVETVRGDLRGEIRASEKRLAESLRDEFRGEIRASEQRLSESLRDEFRGEIRASEQRLSESLRDEFRGEIRASEQRLAEGGRLQFQQLAGLYRSTLEKVEHLEKHLGERIDATRGSIESLRSALERQDFRADELGRRMTALETRQER
jgi:hypothetical protein